MLDLAVDCVKSAGAALLRYSGAVGQVRVKENPASIVTDADLHSEQIIIGKIRERYPDHGIIAEESGFLPGKSDYTWVIDPLDGTSNFAAGLPWFGVILAVLERGVPVLGAMYMPVRNTLYTCERGDGVLRDGTLVRVTAETELSSVLCAYSFDPSFDPVRTRREVRALESIVGRVRNIRSTNSLVDFCYTIDGRMGVCVNQASRIWDIAAASLMFPEAGGVFTDTRGREISFKLDSEVTTRNYSIVGSNPVLHPRIISLLADGK
jgi:myo-inositol-1(or 4)-monophosphatase